jgi:DeoR family glycerol-3-phosphate regulon repressor
MTETSSPSSLSQRGPVAERRSRLSAALREAGYLSIGDLARLVDVSEMTVRRDLDHLATTGPIERTHGGAVYKGAGQPMGFDRDEPALEERIRKNAEAKWAIARAAHAMVAPGKTLALDIGSTALCLADRLRDEEVRIFTYSLRIAEHLARHRARTYLPGGELRGSEPSLVGPIAREQLHRFRFDFFFLGASGISPQGFFDYSLDDSEIKQTLLARSAHRVALLDSSKFDRLSNMRIGDLSIVDTLVTDQPPPAALEASLAEAGVSLCLA